jgi:hypothetical protein
MLKVSKPSLRNFAVAKLIHKGFRFSLWAVLDRRTGGNEQLLLVPTRVISWPRLVARFNELMPSVIKLRSARVALLFGTQISEEDIARASHTKFLRVELNAVTGFMDNGRINFRLWLVAPTVLASLLIALTLQSPTESNINIPHTKVHSTQKPVSKCSIEPKVGDQMPIANRTPLGIQIGQTRFTLALSDTLGGLYRIKLVRECDGKQFRLDAWREGKYLMVSKVD